MQIVPSIMSQLGVQLGVRPGGRATPPNAHGPYPDQLPATQKGAGPAGPHLCMHLCTGPLVLAYLEMLIVDHLHPLGAAI